MGAGLANSLLALKLHQDNRKFILLESKTTPLASQTWSLHESDISPEQLKWLKPIISRSWPNYEVRFNDYSRQLGLGYCSISGKSFLSHLRSTLSPIQICFGTDVKNIQESYVELATGQRITGNCIIDARGIKSEELQPTGYQKFVGLDLQFNKPHGLTKPILMDATVPQTDGFRFIYTLPWDEKTLLVEDTHYSETANFDKDHYQQEVLGYAKTMWSNDFQVIREESAALPIPLTDNIFKNWSHETCGVPLGLRGGFFHPTTGYSLPWALQNAFLISEQKKPTTASVKHMLVERLKVWRKRCSIFLILNRMLFGAAYPAERVKVFSRFYKLSPEIISRFFAANLNSYDIARLLIGRPPVKISRALKSIFTKSWMEPFKYVHS